jgi:glycosyltransferase involved in cell wall biosynthesis
MRILFVHQNFPGQWVHLARHYKQAGHEVVAIRDAANERKDFIPTAAYAFKAPVMPTPHPIPFAAHFEERVARAEAVAVAGLELKKRGFEPDLIAGHGGWGENLMLREVWPRAKQILYAEFCYRTSGADTDFDPEFGRPSMRAHFNTAAKNAVMFTALAYADRGLAPTYWQRDGFPEHMRDHIEVIHDGIDTEVVRPDPDGHVMIGGEGGVTLKPGDEVITFVSRNLEPYRGYHIFMRALPKILKERPKARVIIVGGDGVSYGRAAPEGKNWKDIFLNEVKDRLDLSRVHFVGRIPYGTYLNVLHVSSVHVYLTYPFVLSWSMLESMAAGCIVVGSRTPPVQEVLEHGKNGMLVDFFDVDGLANMVTSVLKRPAKYRHLRHAARETAVKRYDLKTVCLPKLCEFFEATAGKKG